MDPATEFEEKRKDRRVADSFPLKLNVRTPYALHMKLGAREIDAVAGDIGMGGLGLFAKAEIPSDAILDLKFKIYNESAATLFEKYRTFDLQGRVCYSIPTADSGYRLGISFLHISGDDLFFIQNYIGSRG